MMKTNMKFFAAAAVMTLAMGAQGAWAATTASASATATVIAPIAIDKTTNLVFGKFSADDAGTVVIANGGGRTKTGGVVLATGITASAASYSISGEGTQTFSITLPSTATLTHTDTTTTMTAGSFTASLPTDGTAALVDGAATLNVGATLTVDAAQKAGAYTGSFDVIVAYN